jgi:hypothetical protein
LATFAKDTADKTGVSDRTIRRDALRGDEIGTADLTKVVGTSLDEELDLRS